VLIVSFGHAGNGNIHVNLLGNTEDTEERARMERCLADVFSAVLAHRGTLSGEHGIGLAKRDYVGLELSPEVMGLMRGIKTVFDPAGILNPGKGLPETT
jgi:D-lactate dehydrogenase